MTTPKVDVSKQIAQIDAHLKENAFKAGKAGDTRTSVCKYWNLAKPILMLLGQILGKTVGAGIAALGVALDSYCSASLKATPKAITAICKAWGKVKPFLGLAIQIFGGKADWAKALTGLSAGIDSLCLSLSETAE